MTAAEEICLDLPVTDRPAAHSGHAVADPSQAVADPSQAVADPSHAVADPSQALPDIATLVGTIRQSVLEGTSFLTTGKPLVLGSFDIPGSTRHTEVTVVMEPAS